MPFSLFSNRKIISLPITTRPKGWSTFGIQSPHDPELIYTFPRGKHNPEKKKIEEGSNSKIYSGKSSCGDEIVVRKLIIPKDIKHSQPSRLAYVMKHAEVAQKEIKLVRSIQKNYPDNAEYIMDIYTYAVDMSPAHENLFVVMQKGDIDLLTFIHNLIKEKIILPEHEIYRHFKHILLGLIALNKEGAFQCDLKPENLVFHNGSLKHIDLGSVAWVNMPENLVFSPNYCTPEIAARYIYQDKSPSFFSRQNLTKVQSFLAGNILYLFCTQHSFSDVINKQWNPTNPKLNTLASKRRFMTDLCAPNTYARFYDQYFSKVDCDEGPMFLIKHLTDPDIEKRWTIEQALEFIEATHQKETKDEQPTHLEPYLFGLNLTLTLGTAMAVLLFYTLFKRKS